MYSICTYIKYIKAILSKQALQIYAYGLLDKQPEAYVYLRLVVVKYTVAEPQI